MNHMKNRSLEAVWITK